ncbi:MAG TPA: DUF748 domain-containing protein [Methylomirabilota bacterium]|nr:DUF748 domain-containing protein [Methylomirabilota bacterium]
MSRRSKWVLGTVVAMALVAVAASFFLEEPLRRETEKQMNARLKGYTAHIGSLSFHPIGFSIDFRDVILAQQAHPDPPVLKVTLLHASLQWSALIHGRVVADFLLDRPIVYVDHAHFVSELNDPTPVKDHGWQDALQAMYPAKINLFRIRDGSVTYVDAGQERPLTLKALNASARNIRNVRSEKNVYPSPLNVDAVVFDNGRLAVDGAADFLREPYAGFKGRVELDRIALDYFKPIAKRYGFAIERGSFGGRGEVEYSPDIALVDLQEIRVDGLQGDYAYRPKTAAPVAQAATKTAQAAKQVSNAPDVVLRARKVNVNAPSVGFVNLNADPHYRVFFTDATVTVDNFTNQKSEGLGTARITGRLQGSGRTTMTMTMRPENHGPDFDVQTQIQDVDLRAMNDLLLATAKFDVASGGLSVFSQATVKNGRVDGYVKPLFKDLRVYEKDKDQDKTFGQKVKEKAIDVASKVLKNHPRKEVATVVPISGPVDNPRAGTWPTLVGLVRNAFFKAILPGFEREREMVAAKR